MLRLERLGEPNDALVRSVHERIQQGRLLQRERGLRDVDAVLVQLEQLFRELLQLLQRIDWGRLFCWLYDHYELSRLRRLRQRHRIATRRLQQLLPRLLHR